MQWLVENHPTKPANAVWADALVLKLKEADFFGEIALLSGKPRQATVKAVGPVSVLVMSRDAFTRLCGPLFEILRRNMATYSTLELPDEPAPQGAGEEEDPVGDTQDDEGGEEEDVAMPADYKGRQRGRRNNVFVESAKVEDGWVPPFYEKTADEKARLEGYISKTFLLSFLDVKVSRRRKPALPNQRPARCGVTCEPPRPHVCGGGGGALGRHVTRWSMRLRRRITPRTTRSSGRHAPAARAPQCRSAAAMPRHALLSALLVGAQGEDGDYYYILDSGHTEVWLSKPPGTPEVKVFEYSVGGGLWRARAAARGAAPGDGARDGGLHDVGAGPRHLPQDHDVDWQVGDQPAPRVHLQGLLPRRACPGGARRRAEGGARAGAAS